MCSAYVWPKSIQGQGHNLRLNILTVFRVRSISFEPLVGFTNNFTQMSSMIKRCAVPMFEQGRVKVKIRPWWDDVQCLCLTNFCSTSRSQFKIKHCMTVFRVHFLSFKPLVGFTNNFHEMLAMMRRWPRLVQGQSKKLTLFPMLHMGYSSPSVIAVVYDFTFLYQFFYSIWGIHDWFCFRKHLSS